MLPTTKISSTENGLQPQLRERDWAWAVSTLLGLGHLQPGPGTWGSAVTVALWYAVARALPQASQIPVEIAWTALATAIGIPAATREARRSGIKDPSHVVIDEMAGQMLTLIAAPVGWKTLLLGFILFRCFDVLKPSPLRRLERLREGLGIVIDDLGAGVYGLVVLQLLTHVFSGVFR
jgi:phosphatidylglycerophosphatase A